MIKQSKYISSLARRDQVNDMKIRFMQQQWRYTSTH